MKVLDLQCAHAHRFEGWFGSEEEFSEQCERRLIECPICANASITKLLSAPRLNLGALVPQPVVDGPDVAAPGQDLQAALMAVAKRIVAETDDVGEQFADEARKIHYGETAKRGIRGVASVAQTRDLLEEGIAVMPLPLPEALKRRLQ